MWRLFTPVFLLWYLTASKRLAKPGQVIPIQNHWIRTTSAESSVWLTCQWSSGLQPQHLEARDVENDTASCGQTEWNRHTWGVYSHNHRDTEEVGEVWICRRYALFPYWYGLNVFRTFVTVCSVVICIRQLDKLALSGHTEIFFIFFGCVAIRIRGMI